MAETFWIPTFLTLATLASVTLFNNMAERWATARRYRRNRRDIYPGHFGHLL